MNKVIKNIKSTISFFGFIVIIMCVVITYCYVKSNAVSNYKTILRIASENCNLEVTEFLVGNVLDVNTQIPSLTALHYASDSGCLEVVRFLAGKEANINSTSGYENWTPLHHAADQGHLEVVKFLLEKGANPTLTAKDGRRPRNMAVWESRYNKDKPYREIIKLLAKAEDNFQANK